MILQTESQIYIERPKLMASVFLFNVFIIKKKAFLNKYHEDGIVIPDNFFKVCKKKS